ncbi:TetR/AcrR family transcriptional regulator [Rhodococcus chondri]|uniref:TetR/AcrR family transcriptional regulator n=1 Tax=Rhodococcus chondri TaxID=3065941 RepID=A0ABU7JQS7_9NOCA|nr:TetR/AcrR family transcriptional regulator [Rhodococcus sp. CC-R104]MEE2032381.1 TetR/AcrR family transcriptional regulator [Rhodococcus sp. CC-R104]
MTSTSDGRTARAERTRRAVIDAHIALIEAGELKPTGAQIAEQAGVSLRALWVNFSDLETLFAATGAELLRRQDAMFVPVSPGLDLPERVGKFCVQRAKLLEFIAPYARAAALREPFSRELRTNRMRHIERVTDEVEILFARELAPLPSARRTQAVQALGIASTWASWAVLRDEYNLAVADATVVMRQTVAALLAAAVHVALG